MYTHTSINVYMFVCIRNKDRFIYYCYFCYPSTGDPYYENVNKIDILCNQYNPKILNYVLQNFNSSPPCFDPLNLAWLYCSFSSI